MIYSPELVVRLGGIDLDLNVNRIVLLYGSGCLLAHAEWANVKSMASPGFPSPEAPVTVSDADLSDLGDVLESIPAGKPAVLALTVYSAEFDVSALAAALPEHIRLLVLGQRAADSAAYDASIRFGAQPTLGGGHVSAARASRGLAYAQATLDRYAADAEADEQGELAHLGLPVEITQFD